VSTVGALLSRCLRAAGVTHTFGGHLPDLPTIATPGDWATTLLADCEGRLGPAPGCGLHTDGTLRISSRPGAEVEPVTMAAPEELPAAVTAATAQTRAGAAAAELRLTLDLEAPAPPDLEPVAPVLPRTSPEPLAPAAGGVVVLVGPGVVRAGAIGGLRAFADAAGVGVANTWGAKGVFAWDSPHHMGTAGLQERDFELLGFGDAAVVIPSGVDADESPPDRFALAPVVPVAPARLSAELGAPLARDGRAIPPNQLYERLAAVAQPGYVARKVPLHPARAVADVRAALPAGGVVAADPGLAGLWVARAFPTTEPESVVVPATVAPGAAAGIALATAHRGRPAIAVVTEPLDNATRAILELARAHDLPLVVSVWGTSDTDHELTSVDDHATALATAFASPGVDLVRVPISSGDTAHLVEAAGPVVAWPELPRSCFGVTSGS
jgi:thiamine pyrophosphate-dependent acetolactate synthase large subunit-like protein